MVSLWHVHYKFHPLQVDSCIGIITELCYFAGVGFVGRHLTTLLVENSMASFIRVADKAPPATGWLNARHKVELALITSHLYSR